MPYVLKVLRSEDYPDAQTNHAFLSPTERRRAGAFRNSYDREDFCAARILARMAVAESASVPADCVKIVQLCSECGSNEHGAPSVGDMPQIFVSWSHTARVVAAVAGPDRVGVDVENVAAVYIDRPLLESSLAPREVHFVERSTTPRADFLALWTRKEALVKVGEIALDDFAKVEVLHKSSWREWRLQSWIGTGTNSVLAVASRGPVELSDSPRAGRWSPNPESS